MNNDTHRFIPGRPGPALRRLIEEHGDLDEHDVAEAMRRRGFAAWDADLVTKIENGDAFINSGTVAGLAAVLATPGHDAAAIFEELDGMTPRQSIEFSWTVEMQTLLCLFEEARDLMDSIGTMHTMRAHTARILQTGDDAPDAPSTEESHQLAIDLLRNLMPSGHAHGQATPDEAGAWEDNDGNTWYVWPTDDGRLLAYRVDTRPGHGVIILDTTDPILALHGPFHPRGKNTAGHGE